MRNWIVVLLALVFAPLTLADPAAPGSFLSNGVRVETNEVRQYAETKEDPSLQWWMVI